MADINPNAEEARSQCGRILSWLESGHSLTTLEALYMFGCIRCGARIADLRRAGHDINTEMIITKNGKRVARYTITPKSENHD